MQGEFATIDKDYDVTPRLGMEFQTIDEAWAFWNFYGGRKGFSARKGKEYKKDDVITVKTYFCNCAGKRVKDKRDHLTKDPRAETRTDCQVYMRVKFERSFEKYEVVRFVSEHNHDLHKPEARYLMRSQRKVSQVAAIDIQLADGSGIRPKAAYELHCRQGGGIQSIGYTEMDHRNCLRDQRKEVMKYGSVVALAKYFARRQLENPSFKHYEDTNEEQEIANIVWTDGTMIAAYARFGDVVVFDTTFGTNSEKWAFGVFVGFNHFREIVIFDVALMCDQSNRNANLFRIVTPTFGKASQNEERAQYLENELLAVVERYEKKYENLPRTSGEVNPTSQDSLQEEDRWRKAFQAKLSLE